GSAHLLMLGSGSGRAISTVSTVGQHRRHRQSAPSASAPLQIRTSPSARDRLSVTYVLRHGGGTGPSQDGPRSGRAQVRTGPSQDGPKSGRTQVGTGQ